MGVSRYLGLCASLALWASPGAALARDEAPLVMVPASAWVIDRAEDSCAVRRGFQAGEEQVLLELRKFGPGGIFQMTLSSDTVETAPGSPAPRVRFNPGDDPAEINEALFFHHERTDGVLFPSGIWQGADKHGPNRTATAQEREARELAITGIEVNTAFERDLTLQTGRLFAPMADLNECMDALLVRWGVDPAVQKTLTRPATMIDQADWARRVQSSYLAEQTGSYRSGVANFRLIVGADGKPSLCIPNKDSADHAFDEHACRMTMRYARFEPALDANGSPTASLFTTTIVYLAR